MVNPVAAEPVTAPHASGFGLRPLINLSSLDGWARLHAVRSNPLPLPDNYAVQHEWVTSLYVRTRRDELFAKAIEQTMRRNGGGLRRWLGVNGRSNLGKSDMLINWAISHTQFADGAPVRGDEGYQRIPVLYIEAGPPQRGAGLLQSMCEFVGIVPERNEESMRRQLARVLPQLSTYCIAVDDSHMLKRVDSRSTLLTDTLRAVLRLPVTFIFVGNKLENSALLKTDFGDGYESADQVRERASILQLDRMTLPAERLQYDSMIRRFTGRVEQAIPGLTFTGLKSGALRTELFDQCRGKHGKIFATLKGATATALATSSRDVTADLLAAEWPQTAGDPHAVDLASLEPDDQPGPPNPPDQKHHRTHAG